MKNFSPTMLIKVVTILSLASITLMGTGCGRVTKNLDNHSLNYTKAQKLAPVQIPNSIQTQPFTPLYTVPETGPNTLDIKPNKGKRFVLPKPYSTVKIAP